MPRKEKSPIVIVIIDICLQRHSPLSPDLWLHYSSGSPISTLYQPACARSWYFPISRIFLLIQVDQARR